MVGVVQPEEECTFSRQVPRETSSAPVKRWSFLKKERV